MYILNDEANATKLYWIGQSILNQFRVREYSVYSMM